MKFSDEIFGAVVIPTVDGKVSAADRAEVNAEVALANATQKEHAVTPSDTDLQAKADAASAAVARALNPLDFAAAALAAAAATPASKPELQAAAHAAAASVAAAQTPAELAAAKQEVKDVVKQVQSAATPVPWWQWAILGTGLVAVLGGGISLMFGGKRRK